MAGEVARRVSQSRASFPWNQNHWTTLTIWLPSTSVVLTTQEVQRPKTASSPIVCRVTCSTLSRASRRLATIPTSQSPGIRGRLFATRPLALAHRRIKKKKGVICVVFHTRTHTRAHTHTHTHFYEAHNPIPSTLMGYFRWPSSGGWCGGPRPWPRRRPQESSANIRPGRGGCGARRPRMIVCRLVTYRYVASFTPFHWGRRRAICGPCALFLRWKNAAGCGNSTLCLPCLHAALYHSM